MLKKTIKYTDFNGVEQFEDFYFNLTKTELAKMEIRYSEIHGSGEDAEVSGGFKERLEKIVAAGRGQEIIDTFDDIVKSSYGVRSSDGRNFVKSEEAYQNFITSAAYDAFFMELVTDATAAANFINGVVPATLNDQDKPSHIPSAPEKPKEATPEVQPALTQAEIDEIMRKRSE